MTKNTKIDSEKIIFSLLIICSTVVAIDVVFGWVMDNMIHRRPTTKSEYYMTTPTDAHIVIIGSSRASHHYDTPYISDSLGIPAVNLGFDGRGLTYHYLILGSFLKHNSPQRVILEVLPNDLEGTLNNRISVLYPLITKNREIKEIAEQINPDMRYFLCSNLFRYNSNLVQELQAYVTPYNPISRGFEPLPAKVMAGMKKTEHVISSHIDSLALMMIEKIHLMCKHRHGVELIISMSPEYYLSTGADPIVDWCYDHGIKVIDNRKYLPGSIPEDYFNDNWHMNAYGARVYTDYFMNQLAE